MSLVALAVLVPMLVGVPPGATAPAPGALPPGARVEALDPALGIVRVELPRAGLARSVARLKAAPGTRYVEREAPLTLAGSGNVCGRPAAGPKANPTAWSTRISLPSKLPNVEDVVIGVADTGADIERLGPRVGPSTTSKDFTGSDGPADDVSDYYGHGTLVASLIAADRKSDLKVQGVAVGAPLAIARVAAKSDCNELAGNLIKAFGWFSTDMHPSVVSVSITTEPSHGLRESLHRLQVDGTLVVAAVGNRGTFKTTRTFPWSEPGVLAVGSIGMDGKVARSSTRSSRVDLVAPGPGVPAISALISKTPDKTTTPDGTSFATPIVAAAAALLIAKHPDWSSDDVAMALRQSARPLELKVPVPNPNWGWGVLNVRAALQIVPKRDLGEPNGWAAAGMLQPGLIPAGKASAAIHARIGDGGDGLDLYPVTLGRGQRLTASARTGGARVRLSLWTKTGRSLRAWSAPGGATSMSATAPAAAVYLVAVERASGYGSYRLSLSRK